ncbi:hypothetical protein OKA05_18520 [Luteolibacter arcticus]|uniref:Uncharacterized protein n=1 Tax=Luteolibacter arcticus TaxID=1581411 RepID=A0ABT3GM69_9BACT|nr:hypothetical protein [Luteolibacter arcticus]MCW1924566.1 hypothetical protein [Luteolibacter arcticus]
MITNVHANERPSRFLKSRIENFAEALAFFTPMPQRQVAFLLQIDFWDWEMDEILYAVSNFGDREQAWRLSGRTADDLLGSQGILLRAKTRKSYGAAVQVTKVVAPLVDLRNLVDQWNDLVARCEALLDRGEIEKTLIVGGKVLQDLSKYRKTLTP